MKINGFSFSALEAGIRYKDRLDLGLIYSQTPVVTAGVFTTSLVKAAPVVIDIERLKNRRAQAILVNSGCANACTGEIGMQAAYDTSRFLADQLQIQEDDVVVSSTGVIGEHLNVEAFKENTEALVTNLSGDSFERVADAIMTTDTVKKVCYHTIDLAGKEVKIMGMAKGAGMIMPNMATMLSFIVTDADIEGETLQKLLRLSVEKTFNRITVDGDTSTNDMVVVMANGGAANDVITEESKLADQFKEGLDYVLKDLALQIVMDGEGANKCITIHVQGAQKDADAEQIARTVANSSLVKTAFFGEDANWGRIFGAMGRAGVSFDPDKTDIYFGDVQIVQNGLAVGPEAEAEATVLLKEKEILVTIDLKEGSGSDEMYTCDFSIDYVKINADYRS